MKKRSRLCFWWRCKSFHLEKLFETGFWSGICCLLNLTNGW